MEVVQWSPGVTLDAIEKQVILIAFRFYRGNKVATSKALGISVRTLDTKLDNYEQEGKDAALQRERDIKERENLLARSRGFAPPHPELMPKPLVVEAAAPAKEPVKPIVKGR